MKKIFLAILIIPFFTQSCRKEFDSPPKVEVPVGNLVTIKQIKQWYQDSGSFSVTNDLSMYVTFNSDERSGNLYKTVYVQDKTGAIALSLLFSGGVYSGDSVRIYLKGTYITERNGLLSIDSVNTDNNIIKISTQKFINPITTTLSAINSLDTLQSYLVKLENVQFKFSDVGKTYADGINKSSRNIYIEDCDGNEIILRNSGYANFANTIVPSTKGTLIAVVGEYNGDKQLYIRDINDVQFTDSTRCPGSTFFLYKDFNDNSITSGGWSIQKVIGNTDWYIFTLSGNPMAAISNYSGGSNSQAENWLISPSLNLSSSINPILTFRNAYKYTGDALKLYVSTNYTSGLPATATWTEIPFTLSPGNFTFVNSGNINLSAYKSSNVRIAFKYTGTNSNGSTWELDDIKVSE